MRINPTAAQIACRKLIDAYRAATESESVDWSAIDLAYQWAQLALGETHADEDTDVAEHPDEAAPQWRAWVRT